MQHVSTLRRLRLAQRYTAAVALGERMLTYISKNPEVYEELCIAYYHTGLLRKSFDCLEAIFALRPRDVNLLNRSVENKLLFREVATAEVWKLPPLLPVLKPSPIVTVTITSCKRAALFLQTLESFNRCLVDAHLVAEYVCIDDNSSESDRALMKQMYPNVRYLLKTPANRGHVDSMQTIARTVSTPFVFHLEDDWLFYNRVCISDMLEILMEDENLKQVCVNRNYSVAHDRRPPGGIEAFTAGGLRYFIHEYCASNDEKAAFVAKHGTAPSCSYWPHFTLQPSLIDATVFGLEFRNVPHFELDFANRFTAKGWKTAFLQESSTTHTGKNIWEFTGSNAYELNSVTQF